MFDWLKAPSPLVVLGFLFLWLVLWLPIALPLSVLLKWRPPQPIAPTQKLPLLASLYWIAPVLIWSVARVDQITLADYGLPWSATVLSSAFLGIILGVLGLGAMFAIQWQLGWVRWQPPQMPQQIAVTQETDSLKPPPLSRIWWSLVPTLGLLLLIGLGISLVEELVFRGFLLNQLQRDYATGLAAAISSIIFAVLHLIWEGRENIPSLPGLWLMGMVLTLARWVDGGDLGLAWGLHAGWIWTIASLDITQVMIYTGQSAPWMTGLDEKPLAGIMGLLFLLGTGAVLWRMGWV